MSSLPNNNPITNWINVSNLDNRNNATAAAALPSNAQQQQQQQQQYALSLQLSQSGLDLFDPAGSLFAAVSSQSNLYNVPSNDISMTANHAALATSSGVTPNPSVSTAASAVTNTATTNNIATAATTTTNSAANKPKKRFRRTQACDDCRRRKVRCDGNRPSCTSCLRHGVACHYQETLKKRGPKPGYIEKLERRLNLMEKMLMPLSVPSENSSAQAPSSQSKMFNRAAAEKLMRELAEENVDVQSLSNQMDWFSQLGELGSTQPSPTTTTTTTTTSSATTTTTASMMSSIKVPHQSTSSDLGTKSEATTSTAVSSSIDSGGILAKQGSPPPLPRFAVNIAGELANVVIDSGDAAESCIHANNGSVPNACNIMTISPPDTTSPQLRDHLIENVFQYAYYSAPFLHRATFIRQTRDGTVPRMLLYAVMALGVRFSPLPEVRNDPTLRNGMVYAHRAKNLLKQTVAIPDVTSIATLTVLGAYMYACGDMAKSWIATGASLRMAQGLGLHVLDDDTDPDSCIDSGTRDDWIGMEMRRRLWWCLVLTDRFAGVASGRPMAVHEEDCEVKMPCDDSKWFADTLGDGVPVTGDPVPDIGMLSAWTQRPAFNGMNCWMRLALITGRVARYVNRPRQRGPGGMYNGPPDERFSQLEAELLEFGNDTANALEAVGLTDDPTWPPTNVRRSTHIDKLVARDEVGRYTLRIVYHGTLLFLYRSILGSKLNTGCYEAHTPYTISCLRRAQSSADSILAMCARLRPEHYPYSIPPFIFGISAGCLMQLHTVTTGDLGPAAATAAQQKLATALVVLSQTENYWAIAGLHRGMLTELCRMMDEIQNIKSKNSNSSTTNGSDANANSNNNNNNNGTDQQNQDKSDIWRHVRLPLKTSMRELIPLWERAVQRELAALLTGQHHSNKLDLLQPFNTAMEMNDISGSNASNGSESPESRSLTNTPTFKDDDDLSAMIDTPYSPATVTSSNMSSTMSFNSQYCNYTTSSATSQPNGSNGNPSDCTTSTSVYSSPLFQSEHNITSSTSTNPLTALDYSQILQSTLSLGGMAQFPPSKN